MCNLNNSDSETVSMLTPSLSGSDSLILNKIRDSIILLILY